MSTLATNGSEAGPAPRTTVQRVAAMVATVEAQFARIESDEELSESERARGMAACASALSTLGRIDGSTRSMNTAMLLKTPEWALLQAAIVKAIEPWPDALAAVATALGATT